MDIPAVLAKYTRQMRQDILFPDMQKDVLPRIVRFTRPAPGMSLVLYSGLDTNNANVEIESQIAYFEAHNLPFSWKMYGYDSPQDLLRRLVEHGFTPDPPDALMILDLEHTPAGLSAARSVDIRRNGVHQLGDVVQVMEQVWGGSFEWIHERLGRHLALDGYLSVYTVYVDNQPACAGWTYFHPGSEFASLWGGSTVPSQRGKGLYTALLAVRAQEVRQRGVRYLAVDAGKMSQPIVERHGFVKLADIFACDYTGNRKSTSD